MPRIHGYQIIREIGRGGMGRVYEAKELESGRHVALKVLTSELAHQEPEMLERFIQEGRLAAKISHPRSVFVYQAGFQDQRPFIAMELMPGRTLQDELKAVGKLSVQRAVDVTIDVIDGLLAAHNLGVVHRDVKPTNCFVGTDGRVKIGDFGLSKSLKLDSERTQAGTFMGTPSFASPEQVRGEKVDSRSDIYSLGATLYDLLAGRPPFVGDPVTVTAQIVSEEPPLLRSFNPQVPRGLEEICARAMAKNLDLRYQDLEAMRTDLVPFASRGTSLAQMGRRVAAFMIDYGSLQILFQGLMALTIFVLVFAEGVQGHSMGEEGLNKMIRILFWFGVANWFAAVGYFAIGDGIRGATVGKKLLLLRVVNMRGEKPGLWSGLIRAFVIPGALGVPLITMVVTRLWRDPSELFQAESEYTKWILDILPFALLALLCLLTMRTETGLRGVHDLLSGTRLLHLISARKKSLRKFSELPFQNLEKPFHLGRFKIVGGLPNNRDGEGIFLGWDDALHRKVIVFCSKKRTAMEIVGYQANRATRNRWLQGGQHHDLRWDAFEYFGGVPFSFLSNRVKNLKWADVKYAVFDLVREISAAIQDSSLPTKLSFDSLMVNPQGRGRLIDLPVNVTGATTGNQTPATDNRSDLIRGLALMRDVLDWCYAHLLMPNSTNDAILDFRGRPDTPETLDWIREVLDVENRKSCQLTWDERIGVMAFSAGIEWTVVAGLTSLLSWLVLSYVGYFPFWKTLWCWVASLVGVYLVGWLTRGGPAFRLMGIEIRWRNGQLAPDWLCGVRTVLCWMGICAMATCSTYFLEFSSEAIMENPGSVAATSEKLTEVEAKDSAQPELDPNAETWETNVENNLGQILAMIFVVVLGFVISIAGAVFAVISPERGVQDFLLGTRLIPK
ncbi:MAG: protein kinase [Pirellulaceae bacterium]